MYLKTNQKNVNYIYMAKKYKFQNQMLIGLMFGVLLFCSLNGCLHREGMLGGMAVEGIQNLGTGVIKGVVKGAVSAAQASKKAVEDGVKEGQVEGKKEKKDVDDITSD